MIEKSTQSQILADFDCTHGIYQDYAQTVSDLVRQILAASSIAVHSVTSRCKDRSSLARKLSLPGKSYQSLPDITDIAALRITTYFSDDVDRVAKLIENEFEVVQDQSVDKRIALDPDRFGYQSLHYVVTLLSARCNLLEYRRFEGLKTEIQIRSILQHAWAEIEHDIGYKSASGIPRDFRRRFARVAGLLELADAEFASIRVGLNDYAGSVVSEIHKDPAKVELDLLSLRALYEIDSDAKKLDSIVAKAMGKKLHSKRKAVREEFVERFAKIGIHRVDEIEVAAKRAHATIGEFTKFWVTRPHSTFDYEDDTDQRVDAGIGLFYLMYMLVSQTKDRNLVRDYLDSSKIGLEEERDEMVDTLINFDFGGFPESAFNKV